MGNTKLKNLKSQLTIAEKAVIRYSSGQLTPLEIKLGCDVKELIQNWSDTINRLKNEIEIISNASQSKQL